MTPPPVTAVSPTVESDVRPAVYRLADEGMPALDIARHLALSRTEVDLLLELRRLRSEREMMQMH
jgi:hypothetical protein